MTRRRPPRLCSRSTHHETESHDNTRDGNRPGVPRDGRPRGLGAGRRRPGAIHAVPADRPELGDHTWTPIIVPTQAAALGIGESTVDDTGMMQEDPNAPDWLRDWGRPFTITVQRVA
jgi:hypothetical protein